MLNSELEAQAALHLGDVLERALPIGLDNAVVVVWIVGGIVGTTGTFDVLGTLCV